MGRRATVPGLYKKKSKYEFVEESTGQFPSVTENDDKNVLQ